MTRIERRNGHAADDTLYYKTLIACDSRFLFKPNNSGSSPETAPISDSISMAVDAIKGMEYASTIVLVSDGIETCDKDPCALVKKLKETGINFVMHVVGLDVKDKAAEQLACIAEAGGGPGRDRTVRQSGGGWVFLSG